MTVRRPLAIPVIAGLALIQLLLQLVTSENYGIFRDELYYLDCADHLAWGYVDHPPLSIAILAAVKATLGDSIIAIRFLPALIGAALVVLAALLAAELGGGLYAQTIAALAALFAPAYAGITGIYSMNALDLLIWALAFLLLARLVMSGDSRLWLPLGLLLGLGLLNKLSVLFLLAGIAAGMLLTPERRALRDRRPWLAFALALAFFLPHLIWQIANAWPTREFMRNAQNYKIALLSPGEFLGSQILEMGPANVLVWVAGLGYLVFTRPGRPVRLLAWIWLVTLVILMSTRSKPYYLVPAFPPLLAAGGCAFERWLDRRALRPARVAIIALLVAGGLLVQPLARPLLAPADLIAYEERLGLAPATSERQPLGRLPQHFADRFGWEEMVETTARVYAALPPQERTACAILASNYGEAGAVNYFGRRHGLPRAVSGHNNYFLWGPGNLSPRVIITIGYELDDLAPYCETVELAATHVSPYAMPYESDLPIFVVRGLKLPLAEAWRRTRMFI
jgi:hypothetical protein